MALLKMVASLKMLSKSLDNEQESFEDNRKSCEPEVRRTEGLSALMKAKLSFQNKKGSFSFSNKRGATAVRKEAEEADQEKFNEEVNKVMLVLKKILHYGRNFEASLMEIGDDDTSRKFFSTEKIS